MISRSGQPWIDADDDELRKLFAAAMTVQRIALWLGRSREAIKARKVLLRLRRG